jgi:hypothetical protein
VYHAGVTEGEAPNGFDFGGSGHRGQKDIWKWYTLNGSLSTRITSQKSLKQANFGFVATSTWRTYDEAVAALEKYPERYAGVGRVIAHEDPYVGIDLDGVRSHDGITPDAKKLLELLNSYSEVSPSGAGIKVWVRARLERSYVRPGLEIYQGRRYLTLTGQLLPQFSARIENRQRELETLVSREFPTRVRQERIGEYDGPAVDLEDYLERAEVFSEVHDGQGIKFAIRCPWADEHSNGVTGTYLGQRHNGATWFYCHHAHCAGRGWREFTKALFWNRRVTVGPNLTVEVKHG